jgi:flagellar basal-body rod modification protein FlgD
MTTTSSTTGTTGTTGTSSTTTTHKTSLDQDAYLKILVAQLNHQDPNNPMDDKEMTAQLAQFSSLEQLTNINKGIQSLVDAQSSTNLLSGVNYIGKSIKSTGYNLTKSGDTISTMYYSLGESVSNMNVNIYDSDGTLVRSESLGSKGAGDYTYVWDGKDTNGNKKTDGTYGVAIVAEDTSGSPVLVSSKISGVVTGAKVVNGATMLTLADGRTVDISTVTEVVNTATTSDATTAS